MAGGASSGGPSLHGASRAVLERAGSRQPANRGSINGIGPRHIGHRLARMKALERFLALMRRHLGGTAELHASGLRTDSTLTRPGADQFALELRKAAEHGQHQPAVGRRRIGPAIFERFEASTALAEVRTKAGEGRTHNRENVRPVNPKDASSDTVVAYQPD